MARPEEQCTLERLAQVDRARMTVHQASHRRRRAAVMWACTALAVGLAPCLVGGLGPFEVVRRQVREAKDRIGTEANVPEDLRRCARPRGV